MLPIPFVICGLDEIERVHDHTVTHLISILDPGYPRPAASTRHPEGSRLELRFHDILDEQAGQVAPALDHLEAILAFGSRLAPAEPGRLLVHCHAGVSRSTAAAVLLAAAARPEAAAAEVFRAVDRVRPVAWPNLRMIELGDRLLARNGALVEALAGQYRLLLERNPGWRRYMIEEGRQRELALAGDAGGPARPEAP